MSVDAVDDSVTLDSSGFKERTSSTWNGREVQTPHFGNAALWIRAMAFAHLGAQRESLQAVRKLEQEIYALRTSDDPEADARLTFIPNTANWTLPEFAKAEERVKLLLNDPTRPRNPLYLNSGLNRATPHSSYVIPPPAAPSFRSRSTSLPTTTHSSFSAQPRPWTSSFQSPPKHTESPPLSIVSPVSPVQMHPNFRARDLPLPSSAFSTAPTPVAHRNPSPSVKDLPLPSSAFPTSSTPVTHRNPPPSPVMKDFSLPASTFPTSSAPFTHQRPPPSSLMQVGLAEVPSCTAPPLPLPSPSLTSPGFRPSNWPSEKPFVSPFPPPPSSPVEAPLCKLPPVGLLPMESPHIPFLPNAGQPPPPPERFVPPHSPFPGGPSVVADRVLPIPPPLTPSKPLPVIPPLVDQPKKTPEPKTVGFFDPDAPPRVYSLEPPPPPTPKVFEIPGKKLARGAIGGINGMGNSFADATANAEYIAKLSDGHQIQWVHNKSNTIGVDILETIFANSIGYSAPAQDLVESWTAFHKKHKNDPGAKYFQICHSQGAFHVLNALFKAPKEIRDRIIVLAIAPAVVIPKALCFKSFNYASRRDIIPDLGTMTQYNSDGPYQEYVGDAAVGDFRELIFLDPHPDAPLFDHGLDSLTVRETIEDHLGAYVKEYGGSK